MYLIISMVSDSATRETSLQQHSQASPGVLRYLQPQLCRISNICSVSSSLNPEGPWWKYATPARERIEIFHIQFIRVWKLLQNSFFMLSTWFLPQKKNNKIKPAGTMENWAMSPYQRRVSKINRFIHSSKGSIKPFPNIRSPLCVEWE